MKQDKRMVVIHLKTTIDNQGVKEYTTIKQTGEFIHRNGVDVLVYEETHEEAVIRNFVTIREGKVNIKRSGIIAMNQQFHPGKKTETYYQHPHGRLHMETNTHSIRNKSLAKNKRGQLTIDYTVTLNEVEKRSHLLELTYYEEDEQ